MGGGGGGGMNVCSNRPGLTNKMAASPLIHIW